ncbi:MAG: ECF transporter S component [Ignisphaera sp.]
MAGVGIKDVIRVVVYTIITFVATVLLTVETPATGGYFNLGEAAIYTIAFIAPPLVTAISSGLGPALADLALGYWYFAPATFVIKFSEGFIVSKLLNWLRSKPHGKAVLNIIRVLAIVLAATLAIIVIVTELSFGGGVGVEFSWTPTTLFGLSIPIPNLRIVLPSIAWIVIAVVFIIVAVLSIAIWGKPYVISMAVGGLIMVTGYFLYEYFVSNPIILHREAQAAIFEIPVNIGQFVAGIILSYPLVQFIERAKGSRG